MYNKMLSSLIQQKMINSQPLGEMRALRPTEAEIYPIRSEVDQFPYPRFFRGRVSSEPHVFTRYAGWSPQLTPRFDVQADPLPDLCFQAPCNTIFGTKKEKGHCVLNPCITLER